MMVGEKAGCCSVHPSLHVLWERVFRENLNRNSSSTYSVKGMVELPEVSGCSRIR